MEVTTATPQQTISEFIAERIVGVPVLLILGRVAEHEVGSVFFQTRKKSCGAFQPLPQEWRVAEQIMDVPVPRFHKETFDLTLAIPHVR